MWATKSFNSTARTISHYEFGDAVCDALRSEFGRHASSVAATCRFEIQGPGSEGQNNTAWGNAIRTRVQSFVRPNKNWLGGAKGTWFYGNSEDSANHVLGCFGLSCEQLYNAFGYPILGVKYQVDLMEVIQSLAPEFIRQTVAVNTITHIS